MLFLFERVWLEGLGWRGLAGGSWLERVGWKGVAGRGETWLARSQALSSQATLLQLRHCSATESTLEP